MRRSALSLLLGCIALSASCAGRAETVATSNSVPPAQSEADWAPADKRTAIQNVAISFTDQDGRTGNFADLLDKPVLITFFYTRCQNSSKCSAAVVRLAALQRELARARLDNKVRLLAITYEPQVDTPERINRYGVDRGLQFGRDAMAIQLDLPQHQLLVDELEAPVNFNAGWVNTHGVELSFLDAHRRIVKKYQTLLWDNDRVMGDVRRVLMETASIRGLPYAPAAAGE